MLNSFQSTYDSNNKEHMFTNFQGEKLMLEIENYNVDEEFLYNKPYLFIKGYATGRSMKYTLKALPLVRQMHDGTYRKGVIDIDGQKYQLPYVLHVLKVATTLISLSLPLTDKEMDTLIACALLHDIIEEKPEKFQKEKGHELVNKYGFTEEIFQIVKLLSKHSGATEDELKNYFNQLKKNKYALLIKMSDRSHNVEDLYNMKVEKLHKYVNETRNYIYPLSSYAKANYPELSNGVTILKSKIVSLTELTETLSNMYEEKMAYITAEKDAKIEKLTKQLERNQTSVL